MSIWGRDSFTGGNSAPSAVGDLWPSSATRGGDLNKVESGAGLHTLRVVELAASATYMPPERSGDSSP
ncbi:hypothetical protein RRG08_060973 [Elysia crispata]|uniref:Uncharacterized protein n=1 Tax=Elysia crispata TaxID=231223 RepID=A0AAE1AUS4_9GAST|nr:hypothetical protein RRG08_060973 [Elysia crispata]